MFSPPTLVNIPSHHQEGQVCKSNSSYKLYRRGAVCGQPVSAHLPCLHFDRRGHMQEDVKPGCPAPSTKIVTLWPPLHPKLLSTGGQPQERGWKKRMQSQKHPAPLCGDTANLAPNFQDVCCLQWVHPSAQGCPSCWRGHPKLTRVQALFPGSKVPEWE